MSRLLRMAYGHGGAGRERILVAAPSAGPVPAPRWLKPLLLIAWLAVPILVSRFGLPTASQTPTIIDVSRLDVAPLPLPEPPVTPEPPPARHVEPPLPAPAPLAQPPVDTPLPVINRPATAPAPEQAEYQPRIARTHVRASTETGTPAVPQIRRESTPGEAPAQRTAITRTRGVVPAETPVTREQLPPPRLASGTEEAPQGAAVPQRPLRSSTRTAGAEALSASLTRNAPHRGGVQATAAGEAASPAPGVAHRGISLNVLDNCASTQEQDDAIKAVLGVVGSRQSCTDEKGEFQFMATKRISSFNLIIYPGNGRKPSNQCEELKNAYRCLKAR
jgi:hypothetical protein